AAKRTLVDAVRLALPHDLIDQLAMLAGVLRAQPIFAERSAAWARAAGAHLPPADTPGASAQAFPWLTPRVEYVLRPQQLEADAHSAKRAKLPERTAGQQGGDSTFAAEEFARAVSGESEGYRIFTTAHDRIVN